MTGMKITVDAAMRARDVSRPSPADELANPARVASTSASAAVASGASSGSTAGPEADEQLPAGQQGERPRQQAPGRPRPHRRARLRGGQPI